MTNISEWHKEVFDALKRGSPQFALFSCFLDEEPTVAIVSVEEFSNKEFCIRPVFVAVPEGMTLVLTDHEGNTPKIEEGQEEPAQSSNR